MAQILEQNFQPQTRDTTSGPHLHTYIPRADGSIMVGGVAYIPQTVTGVATATTIPIPVTTAIPAVPAVVTSVGGGATVVQPAMAIPVVPAPPVVYQQPYIAQPQPTYSPYASYPTYSYASTPYPSAPYTPYAAQPQPAAGMTFPSFNMQQPAYGTYGLTGSELLAQQMSTAQGLEMNKKQEMKPADDDPFRMYWCRELDNTWTQRNRLTIDSGDIGDCRWYAMDGQFYVVKLPS